MRLLASTTLHAHGERALVRFGMGGVTLRSLGLMVRRLLQRWAARDNTLQRPDVAFVTTSALGPRRRVPVAALMQV